MINDRLNLGFHLNSDDSSLGEKETHSRGDRALHDLSRELIWVTGALNAPKTKERYHLHGTGFLLTLSPDLNPLLFVYPLMLQNSSVLNILGHICRCVYFNTQERLL